MITKWQLITPDKNTVSQLAAAGGLSPAAAAVLVMRGADTIEKAAAFFSENSGSDEEFSPGAGFSDPFLIRDMEKACSIILEAADSGALICVYGDYDCDGVTAAALLSGYLTDIGANVITHINEREMGYGMNAEAIRTLKDKGVELIVTVDNGISAVSEAALCRELGIRLVITDHHQPGETLPDADAVVDPHRQECPSPFKDLCGCGLALKLVAALEGGDMDSAVEQYSDLAAIATIADVVPLRGENRRLVRLGLHYLENTENPGLTALIEASGIKPPYTSEAVAFGIAPRINAAGRIGSPSDALRLITCEDDEEAQELSERICRLNNERRELEKVILEDISRQVAADPSLLDGRTAVFCGTGWHHGVVGIAAARCAERFGIPVFLMSGNENEDEVRGSARSVEGLNIFKALSYSGEVLERFGGHSGAGGFSLSRENVPGFARLIEEYAAEIAGSCNSPRAVTEACGGISPVDLTVEAVEGLDILEPFGEGNPRPLFLIEGICEDIIALKGGDHTKLMVNCGGTRFPALMFGTKTDTVPYRKGEEVNMLVTPEINEYGGKKSVTLKVADIRKKGLNQSKLIAAEETYKAFRRGEGLDLRLTQYITPKREELIEVYRAMGKSIFSPLGLYGRTGSAMNYCKFLICLDIFEECGLIFHDRCRDLVGIIEGAPKADTDKAPTMQKLKCHAAV